MVDGLAEEGCIVSVSVDEVRGPTKQELAREKNRQRNNKLSVQRQPSQRSRGKVLIVEANVVLPAAQAQQQQQQQQQRAGPKEVRYVEGASSRGDSGFRAGQRLHSTKLLISARAQLPSQDEPSQAADASVLAEQQQQAEAELLRQLWATLAGLLKWQLKWQLRGQQRKLLQLGSFALLQVQTRDQALPAKPTVGARRLGKLGVGDEDEAI